MPSRRARRGARAARRRAGGAGRAQPAERGRARSPRSSSPASRARTRGRVLAEFGGVGRRFEARGEAGGVTVVDDYAHHPAELEAAIARRARATPTAACSSSSSRTSTRARGTSRASSARALAAADAVCVTEIYPAREEPVAGRERASSSSTRSRERAARDAGRAGRRPSRTAARSSPPRARPGDVVAHRRRRRRRPRPCPLLAGGARVTIEERRPARAVHDARHGGPGALVRPAGDARRARAGARAGPRSAELPVAVVGLGSNLLVADEGVDGARAQARAASSRRSRSRRAARRGRRGAANAVCLHRARAAGLGGLRVRVRDPRHGRRRRLDERRRLRGRLGGVLERALVVTRTARGWRDAGRARARVPALGARARPGRRARRVPRSQPRPADEIKATRRRAAGAAQGGAADEPADVRQRVQEPRPRALARAGCSRRAGCRGIAIGGAQISPKHANFIENAGGATSADAHRADGGGAPPRARAVRRRARARGRSCLGALELPPIVTAVGGRRARRRSEPCAPALRQKPAVRRRCRAAACAAPSARASQLARLLPVRSLAGRRRSRSLRRRRWRATAIAARRPRCSPSARSRCAARRPPLERQRARPRSRPLVGKSLVALDAGDAVQRALDALPEVARAPFDRAFPHTLRVRCRAGAPGGRAAQRPGGVARLRARPRCSASSTRRRCRACRGSGSRRRARLVRRRGRRHEAGARSAARRGPARPRERSRPASRTCPARRRRAHARAALAGSSSGSASRGDLRAQARGRRDASCRRCPEAERSGSRTST